jgi:hypothetical protein
VTPRPLTTSEERRLFVGLILQPVTIFALAYIFFPVLLLDRFGNTLSGGRPNDVHDAAMSVAFGATLLACVVTLVLVLPAAIWFMKRRAVSLAEALCIGFAIGNAPMAIGSLLAGTYGAEGLVRGIAMSTVLGLGGAAVFWLIALRPHRVDLPA